MKTKFHFLFIVLGLLSGINQAAAQGTAFTYQGELNAGGVPANGYYDFRFRLFSDPLGNNYVTDTLTNGVAVSNGLFTTTMDFGAGIFTGSNYWLEVDVRTNNAASYTALAPLQAVTPVPYAVLANSASNLLGTLPATQLSGVIGNAQLASSNITVAAGSGLSGGGSVALGGSTTLSNAGVLSVTGNADITASTTNGAVTLGSTASSANVASSIVKRAANGNFSAGTITLTGTLSMENSGANTAVGFAALGNNTSGTNNTAVGSAALGNKTSGTYNTAIGGAALAFNTTGELNTAIGAFALNANTTGLCNAANGQGALGENTTGSGNTANGWSSLYGNTTGSFNTANGEDALTYNKTGSFNTADGVNALEDCTTGVGNTASGWNALNRSTTGSYNIALGYGSGENLTTGSNNIEIGNSGALDNNTVRIGTQGIQTSAFIAGISGVTVAGGAAVVVNSAGQLGVGTSSERFKQDIQSMGKASEVLLALRPVTFRYKPEMDPKGTPQFGLVAEEVNKADPDLVLRDGKNQIYTVRYEAVNAMLLNEFLKQHRKVEQQQAEIQALKEKAALVESLEKRLSALERWLHARSDGLSGSLQALAR